jgi:hypothetical protein
VPCGLTNVHHHLEDLLPASSGQKLSSLKKNYVDTGEKGPLSVVF